MNTTENKYREIISEKKPFLYILTPCYNSTCYTSYTTSLINTINACNAYNIEVAIEFCNNDSLVPRARNNLIAKAMSNPKMTHMLFIDADISWDPKDIIKLICSNKLLIGGVYPIKHLYFENLSEESVIEKWKEKKSKIEGTNISDAELFENCLLKYNYNALSNKTVVPQNRITEVRHLATGFMMIDRTLIESMQKAFPSTKYEDNLQFLKKEEYCNAYALFDCTVENQQYYSEDWLFCQRWINMGGKIYADLSIDLTHVGIHQFKGSFLNSII